MKRVTKEQIKAYKEQLDKLMREAKTESGVAMFTEQEIADEVTNAPDFVFRDYIINDTSPETVFWTLKTYM